LSGMADNAGAKPAFMEYRRLGARYGRLIDQFQASRQVHAYLFAGPQGIGKKTFARYLASVLLCKNEGKPCGKCSQCRAISEGRHPSVLEIVPVDGKAVSVDRIRDLVCLSATHTLDGRERIVLIEPAESLTPQAQNCLLKSLEDPDTDVLYFLLSHDMSSILDTVQSRCSVFKLTPWPANLLNEFLERLGYPRDAAARAAALSGGNVGEALDILAEQPEGTQESALNQLLNVSTAKDTVRCSNLLKDLSVSAEPLMLRLERYLQQCMLVKSGLLSADALKGTPWSDTIRSAAMADLIDLTEQVFQTRKRKMSNVNWQSNIDQLTGKLLEAKHKWQRS
jgi:DNA polymerase III subunit delta'